MANLPGFSEMPQFTLFFSLSLSLSEHPKSKDVSVLSNMIIQEIIEKRALNEDLKCKRKFSDNLGHNILRRFHVLPNFSFTTSEMNCDY